MENTAKALEIVAGVLLAVIIISLIVYFFSTISEWPSQEDEMQSAEQLAQFNLEYEVYEKNAMYGVDVISCLNKARSNNQKYVEGTAGFLSGNRYGNDFTIDVYVRISEPLEEYIEVHYFDQNTNKEEQRIVEDSNTKTLEIAKIDELNTARYTAFTKDDKLFSHPNKLTDPAKYIIPDGGTHKITLEDGTEQNYYSSEEDKQLIDLLQLSSTDFKITKKNNDPSTYRYWSTIVWETALYNFKTKRFKCDDIRYNEKTGRVSELYFSEI